MAKADVIKKILEENPDAGYTKEQLDNDYTEKELKTLQGELRERSNDESGPDTGGASDSKLEANTNDNVNVNADVNVKEGAELNDKEKQVIEIQQAYSSGQTVNKKFKLANPDTQYSEEGFTLAGEEEKELPENPSIDLLERIRTGFIKEA
jgi:hypothetical protein